MTTRRNLVSGALAASTLALLSGCGSAIDAIAQSCPTDPEASGGIDWQPDIGKPVFYGVHDLSAAADGTPRNMLVYYPSVDGTPTNAAMLEKCLTRWPVVMFLHGQPPSGVPIAGYHRKWYLLPAQLARCGYVVVVPNHGADIPDVDYGRAVDAVMADLDWVRTTWVHSQWVDPRATSTAVAGHSYGALLAARVAAAHPDFAALVSLSGGFFELNDADAAVRVNPPSYFMWAKGVATGLLFEDLNGNEGQWDRIPQWKYAAVFHGEHFDYLQPDDSGSAHRGPCPYVGGLAAAMVSLFIAENLPTPVSTTHVGVDLMPPHVTLTQHQQFYAGLQLAGYGLFDGSHDCHLELRWKYDTHTGTRTLGQA